MTRGATIPLSAPPSPPPAFYLPPFVPPSHVNDIFVRGAGHESVVGPLARLLGATPALLKEARKLPRGVAASEHDTAAKRRWEQSCCLRIGGGCDRRSTNKAYVVFYAVDGYGIVVAHFCSRKELTVRKPFIPHRSNRGHPFPHTDNPKNTSSFSPSKGTDTNNICCVFSSLIAGSIVR